MMCRLCTCTTMLVILDAQIISLTYHFLIKLFSTSDELIQYAVNYHKLDSCCSTPFVMSYRLQQGFTVS